MFLKVWDKKQKFYLSKSKLNFESLTWSSFGSSRMNLDVWVPSIINDVATMLFLQQPLLHKACYLILNWHLQSHKLFITSSIMQIINISLNHATTQYQRWSLNLSLKGSMIQLLNTNTQPLMGPILKPFNNSLNHSTYQKQL